MVVHKRMWNGINYIRMVPTALTKTDATELAIRYRRKYGSARITTSKKGYFVWVPY